MKRRIITLGLSSIIFCSATAQTVVSSSFEEGCDNSIIAGANTVQSLRIAPCTSNFAVFGEGYAFYSNGGQGSNLDGNPCVFYSPPPTNGVKTVGISGQASIALLLSSDLIPGNCYQVTFDVLNLRGDNGSGTGSCEMSVTESLKFGVSNSSTSFGTSIVSSGSYSAGVTWQSAQKVSFVAPSGSNNYLTIQLGNYSNLASLIFLDQVSLSPLDCSSLPVKLINFRSTANENNLAHVEWETTSEENASHFELEESFDAKEFKKLGELPAIGVGNSGSRKYEMNVPLLSSNTTYLRLKMIDLDGTYSYSKIISVKAIEYKYGTSLIVYPLPSTITDRITIKGLESKKADIYIYSISGKKMYYQQIAAKEGELSFAHNLDKGIYLLKIVEHNGVIHNKRLMID